MFYLKWISLKTKLWLIIAQEPIIDVMSRFHVARVPKTTQVSDVGLADKGIYYEGFAIIYVGLHLGSLWNSSVVLAQVSTPTWSAPACHLKCLPGFLARCLPSR